MASIGLGVGVNGALAAGPGEVTGFTLVNTDTDTPIKSITDGEVINLATLTPSVNHISVVADTDPVEVGSVAFGLDSFSNYHTEKTAPYALKGDTDGDYATWLYTEGHEYTLTATPYELIDKGGAVGTPKTINFTIYNDDTIPEVSSATFGGFSLDSGTNLTINQEFVTLKPSNDLVLNYNDEMDSSIIPTLSFTSDTAGLITCQPVGWTSINHKFTFDCSLSPTVFIEQPPLIITASGAKNLAGNQQTPYTSARSISVDTKAPSLTFDPASGGFTNKKPIVVTATVSENIQNPLHESNFTVSNGDIQGFEVAGNVYTLTINPQTEDKISLVVAAGTYEDMAGNKNTTDTYSITYDVTAPAAVSGLTVGLNSGGYPTISWVNPPVGTYAGLKVLRDGVFLVTLDPTATSFTDLSAARGTTYTYEVVAFDSAGNPPNGTTVAPVVITTPLAAPAVTTSYKIASAAISDSEPQISQATTSNPTNQDVKANENKNTETKDDSNGLPTWGIIFLFILAGIGGYLVYTQKPKPVSGPSSQATPKPKAPKTTRKK